MNDLNLTRPNEQDNIASPRSCSPVDSHVSPPVQTDIIVPLQVSSPMSGVLSTLAKGGLEDNPNSGFQLHAKGTSIRLNC